MLISPDKLDAMYEKICTAAETEKPVYIFASLDCDSACTTKILTSICKQNGCRYIIRPVRGWHDLELKLQDIRELIVGSDLDNIVFINCLGTDDVMKQVFGYEIDEDDFPNLNIFVFDFHKPVHLSNVHSPRMIWIAETEEKCQETYPEQYIEEVEEDSSEEDEFSDSDDEGPPRKKRKLNPEIALQRLQLKRSNDTYYQHTYHGLNSSWFLYQMATKLNKDDNHMLWWAIVGLTKMFIHQQMDRLQYNELVEEFRGFVLRKNTPFVEQNDDQGGLVIRRKKNHIQFSNELQLIMLHHWTIYNSMYYSPIVAAKMNLWKENGKEQIDYLLATMSLPQNEAHQDWDSIELKLQKEFYERFKKHGVKHFGEEIFFGSFTKQHGDFEYLRAADMAHAVCALLEDERDLRDVESEQEVYACVETNFKQSMDALDVENTCKLTQGLANAKRLQHLIAGKALEIINKKRVQSVGMFRYVELGEKNEFYTPLAISNLSLYVQNISTEKYKKMNKQAKPIVVGAWNDGSNTYTVCGVPVKRSHHLHRNPFGRAFRIAAEGVKARVRNITFETYLMEIQRDDWKQFVEKLHEVMVDVS